MTVAQRHRACTDFQEGLADFSNQTDSLVSTSTFEVHKNTLIPPQASDFK